MKKRFEKLIDVKSISTLVLTGVFSYLSIIGKISPELFMTIFTVVIGFYYGTQKEKKDNDNNMNIQGTENIRSLIFLPTNYPQEKRSSMVYRLYTRLEIIVK